MSSLKGTTVSANGTRETSLPASAPLHEATTSTHAASTAERRRASRFC